VKNLSITLVVTVVILLALAGLVLLAEAADFPIVPLNAVLLGVGPAAQCGENFGVYSRTYDLNPETKAAYIEAGVYEMLGDEPQPRLGDPIVVLITDDEGTARFWVRENGSITERSEAEMQEKYTDLCSLPGVKPSPVRQI
jgi:hypothetical protein